MARSGSSVTRSLAVAACLGPALAAAASFQVGTFQKATSLGPQVVPHGLGAAPRALVLWSDGNAGELPVLGVQFSLGLSDGTTTLAIGGGATDGLATSVTSRRLAAAALSLVRGDRTVTAEAALAGWSATSFTLNWTTNDATAALVHFIAIGGAEVSARLVSWPLPASTGTLAVTGVGFRPEVVLSAFVGTTSTTVPALAGETHLNLSVMDARGEQWVFGAQAMDATAPPAGIRVQLTTAALAMADGSGIYTRATWRSMDADGFSLDFTQVFGSGGRVFSLALAGLPFKAGSFTKSTGAAPAAQAVSGLGFQPKLLLLGGVQAPASAAPASQAMFSFGASDGVAQAATALFCSNGINPGAAVGLDRSTSAYAQFASGGLVTSASVTALTPDGFGLSWAPNDTNPAELVYLALGQATADGGTDAGLADGGAMDGGTTDGGATDGGTPDGGGPDGGVGTRRTTVGCDCTSADAPNGVFALLLALRCARGRRRHARSPPFT